MSEGLVSLLQDHGLTLEAAREVERLAGELLNLTRQAGVELAGMVDADSGERLGDSLQGERSEVDITAHVALMLPTHRYVQVHTHPAGGSFSDDDLREVLAVGGWAAMLVLGADGTSYVLSKSVSEFQATPDQAAIAWRRELLSIWRAQVTNPVDVLTEDTRRQAMREATHEVCVRITGGLGLRYARLEV